MSSIRCAYSFGRRRLFGTTSAGASSYQPVIAPVLVAPFGDHWLVESRANIQGFIAREHGTSGPYTGQFLRARLPTTGLHRKFTSDCHRRQVSDAF